LIGDGLTYQSRQALDRWITRERRIACRRCFRERPESEYDLDNDGDGVCNKCRQPDPPDRDR
jgi:hypothetical protein